MKPPANVCHGVEEKPAAKEKQIRPLMGSMAFSRLQAVRCGIAL
jgi:hypothetical protein